MPNVIVLLDVDETCVIRPSVDSEYQSSYRYADALLEALRNSGLTKVYLLTASTLGSISKNLQEEPRSTPSRLKLIQHLKTQGITVQAVITPFDALYHQGMGAYYQQRIEPYEAMVLKGANLRQGRESDQYQAACEQELHLLGASRPADQGAVFLQVAESLSHSSQQAGEENALAFIVVDYRDACLESVRVSNQGRYPLLCLKTLPKSGSDVYQHAISAFLVECYQSEAEGRFQENFPSKPKSDADRLEDQLLNLTQANPPKDDKPYVVVQGLAKPRYLSLNEARRLLSQESDGQTVKTNVQGNNPVVRIGDVFFKRNPEYALVEQAVYQLSELLGGGIITPSRLLFLQMPEGLMAVQASLAVEGIGLDDLLRIPTLIERLQALLKDKLISELPLLLNHTYLNDWLSENPEYTIDLPWERQCCILLDTLIALPPHQRPLELQKGDRFVLEKALREGSALRGKHLLPILALLKRYPDLSNEYLSDLAHLPTLFSLLNQLYPNMSAEVIVKEALQIPTQIDPVSFSRHFILALLTQPQDHKGDNFKVRIARDSAGRLLPFQIIGIDNDAAMQGSVQIYRKHKKKGEDKEQRKVGEAPEKEEKTLFYELSALLKSPLSGGQDAAITKPVPVDGKEEAGEKEHEIRVKTIMYGLDALLKSPLAEQVQTRLLSCNPSLLVLEWLYRLAAYHQSYRPFLQVEAIQQCHLNEQMPEQFVERMVQQLSLLQTLVKQGKTTHEALFLQLEPLTGLYYQALRQQVPDAQALMLKIYERRSPLVAERLLDTLPVEIGTEFQKNPRYQSYLQTAPVLLQSVSFQDSSLQITTLSVLSRAKRQGLQTFKLPALNLTEAVFIAVYTEEPKGFIRLLKENAQEVTLVFSRGQMRLSEASLYPVMSLPQAEVWVHALLEYGASAREVRALDGYTPLHFAARFNYTALIRLLVQKGALLEALDQTHKTALDKAIEYRHWASVRVLLMLGAGRSLQLNNGFTAINAPMIEPIWRQRLIAINQELSWQLALKNLTQEKPTEEKACLEGLEGIRYLRPAIYQQIFGQGHSFPKQNDYGRHSVMAIQCEAAPGIFVGLHLKENPELPGREIMVHHLAKQTFGLITPPVALWRFTKQQNRLWQKSEVAYPVLASRSILGDNLRDVMLQSPERLADLDPQSVSEAIVLALLINPEDGRADNYLLEPIPRATRTLYRLVSIDNDHAFVPPIALGAHGEEQEGPKSLQVKTILFCLSEMVQPLHPAVRERLLVIEPYSLLRDWLLGLQHEQEKIVRIFGAELQKLSQSNIHLEITFKASIVLDLYQKFSRLQRALEKNPQITGLELLRRVLPNLAVRYADAFFHGDNPQARFSWLTEGCFEKKIVKGASYAMSTTNAVRVIEMTQVWEEKPFEPKEEAADSLEIAVQKLTEIHAQKSELKAVREALQRGEVVPFQKLLSQDYQAWVVNGHGPLEGLDFTQMRQPDGTVDLKCQQTVLKALGSVSFKTLRLHHCAALTDSDLVKILKRSSGLMALEIRGCQRLTHSIVADIAKHCPWIERLSLSNLSFSQPVKVKKDFLWLRMLILNNVSVPEWQIKAPQLQRLTLEDCALLKAFTTKSGQLRELTLKNCQAFTEQGFEKLAAESIRPQAIVVSHGGESRGGLDKEAIFSASALGSLRKLQWLVVQGGSLTNKDKDGDNALHVAAANGHLPVVQWLVETCQMSLAEKGLEDRTPALWAALCGHLEALKWLVAQGGSLTDKDKNGDNALHLAAWRGYLPVVQWLVETCKMSLAERGFNDMTPLLQAASGGHLEELQWLLAQGGSLTDKDKDGDNALHLATWRGHLPVVQWLSDKLNPLELTLDKWNALLCAAYNGHFTVLDWFLSAAGLRWLDEEGTDYRKLYEAALKGEIGVIREYADQHALLNFSSKNQPGFILLLLAASAGHLNIVQLLAEQIKHPTENQNALEASLFWMAGNGRLALLQWVDKSIDIKESLASGRIRGLYDQTPLHRAARNGHLDTVIWLVERGVNTELKDDMGFSPLDLARDMNQTTVVEWLESYQALKSGQPGVGTQCSLSRKERVSELPTFYPTREFRLRTFSKPMLRSEKTVEDVLLPGVSLPESALNPFDSGRASVVSDALLQQTGPENDNRPQNLSEHQQDILITSEGIEPLILVSQGDIQPGSGPNSTEQQAPLLWSLSTDEEEQDDGAEERYRARSRTLYKR